MSLQVQYPWLQLYSESSEILVPVSSCRISNIDLPTAVRHGIGEAVDLTGDHLSTDVVLANSDGVFGEQSQLTV